MTEEKAASPAVETTENESSEKYELIRKKIILGAATLAEVRQALTENDTAALTNTMHALYSMRWHRGVFKMLYDMWEMKKHKYPEIKWDAIEEPPVRVALASTLNRIQISNTKVFQNYIRSFQEHSHEFVRAQVVISLGFNGDPVDIPYMLSMAEGENYYVAQSTIAGFGLMGNNEARDALLSIRDKFVGKPRGQVIDSILLQGYDWRPPLPNPKEP